MTIRCEIVSQDQIVYQGEVDIVTLPGQAGDMGILPNHSPLLTVLKYGIITVRAKEEGELHFAVSGGVAEVQPDQVTVLADSAEDVEEIDLHRAEEARERAEKILQDGVPAGTDEYLQIQAALKRSQLRLDAARRYRQGRSRR
jgi:F-type H+-transporting ATPase subunit epsilon